MIRYLLVISILFPSLVWALPFNDDMVENQINTGQLHKVRPEGSIPRGSLKFHTVKNKEAAETLTNPIKSDEWSVKRGEWLFQVNCSACHGEIAPGAHVSYPAGQFIGAPNLADPLYHNRTDGNIYGTIHFGNLIMPAVGWKLSPKETWDIVNYVRSVQAKAK